MAAPRYPTTQYTSEEFVESAGVVLFDLKSNPRRICLIHHIARDEWLLAKGRRNCGESRREAAVREVFEETGYQGRLLPVTMTTRAPSEVEIATAPDKARTYPSLIEPFTVTIRDLGGNSNVKFIWWFVAAVDELDRGAECGEPGYSPQFFPCQEALEKLTYEPDREGEAIRNDGASNANHDSADIPSLVHRGTSDSSPVDCGGLAHIIVCSGGKLLPSVKKQ